MLYREMFIVHEYKINTKHTPVCLVQTENKIMLVRAKQLRNVERLKQIQCF